MNEKNIPLEQKKRILERDKYQCVLCHRKYQLQIHHYYSWSGNLKKFQESNSNIPYENTRDHDLVTLCPSCHGKIHTCSTQSPIYLFIETYLLQFYNPPEILPSFMRIDSQKGETTT